jgi:hypothetical protein
MVQNYLPESIETIHTCRDRASSGPRGPRFVAAPASTTVSLIRPDFKGLSLGKKVTPKAMRRTFQDLARRAAVDGLLQRSICGHLTEEMTERYSSVAQVEVEAALGKVVSLAGYRDLLGGASSGARCGGTRGVVGKWWETRSGVSRCRERGGLPTAVA